MTEKELADLDQAFTQFLRTWPAMLGSLFKALVSEGFSTDQAMRLTSDYMRAMIMRPGRSDPDNPA